MLQPFGAALIGLKMNMLPLLVFASLVFCVSGRLDILGMGAQTQEDTEGMVFAHQFGSPLGMWQPEVEIVLCLI
jgi:hypothetical protein